MSPASSMAKEFSPPSPAKRLSAWSNAALFPAAWFSSWKPPSEPSKAAFGKSALSAALRPMLYCWLRTRRKHRPMTEWQPSREPASSVNLCPPLKRRFRDAEQFLLPTYKRQPVVMTHGRGAYVFDSTGKKYLDFLGGIAVNALGHAHPRIVKVIRREAARAIHLSSLFLEQRHRSY